MQEIFSFLEYFNEHGLEIIGGLTLLASVPVSLCAWIAKTFPPPKAGSRWETLRWVIERIALNDGHAKNENGL